MKNITLFSASLAAMFVALLPAKPAPAATENNVSFILSTGTGTLCTRAMPCGTFFDAYDATKPGGEIKCLDSGPFFNGGTITKSITIDCPGATSTGLVIDGAGIIVTIRNLSINGILLGNSQAILFNNGAALFVENCVLQNYPGRGISFVPSAPGAQLVVTDTFITNNGTGSSGGGIVISPLPSGTAQVALNRVTVAKNVFGIAVDGTGSTGGINLTISDSVTDGNSQDGIVATTPVGGAPIGVMVKNTKSLNNAGFGIRSIGPNVTIRVNNSDVTGNGAGLNFSFGGALLSFGNNAVQGNGANGTFSGSVALQ